MRQFCKSDYLISFLILKNCQATTSRFKNQLFGFPLNESVFLYLHQSNRAVTDLQLYSELSSLPSDLKKEVQDFIEFLKIKARKQGAHKQRKFGGAKGFFKMRADFDEPLEDFKDYM